MKLIINIPKEFEEHFNKDKFSDSLARVASDIENFGFPLSGRYEKETITMLRKAFEDATPLKAQPNRCDSCIHSEEQDGSNCYECVKGTADNFEAQPTDKCKDCYYNDGEAHAECVVCDKEAQPKTSYISVDVNKFAKEVAEKALDEITYEGKTVREWVEIIVKQQPTDEDCISREAVEEITFQEPSYTDPYNILTEVREKVRALPSVYPERPKGKWITQAYSMRITCTNCEKEIWYSGRNDYKYCPSCGAEMEGGEDES